jgi:FKBP-type peptidyl-prolyl cis-trans isomerase (trigger factor)
MSKLMGEAKKNAQFPGFRKGQIPPYAMPKMVRSPWHSTYAEFFAKYDAFSPMSLFA